MTVPPQVRESAYGLGAATSEVVMKVTLPYVRRGAIGAVMLGLGRALGETMAVTFIIGNAHDFPRGLFDAGATIASTIANEFTEATSPMHTAALHRPRASSCSCITFIVLAHGADAAAASRVNGLDGRLPRPPRRSPHRQRRLRRLLLPGDGDRADRPRRRSSGR